MATKQIMLLARQSRRSSLSLRFISQSTRSLSTSTEIPSSEATTPPPPPPPRDDMDDYLAEKLKATIRKIENPDRRFLQYNSVFPVTVDHTNILSAPVTRVTTLPNGLRVATESNLGALTATVGVFVDAGSRYENDETNGVAHFLQHMVFKGTYNRTCKALQEEVEDMGAMMNSYTSREMTTYYAKVVDKDVNQALDILADLMQNSNFQFCDVDRERDILLREMEEAEEYGEEVIFDHLHATAFQHSPLGKPTTGTDYSIKTITREQIQNYLKTHYTAPRMVIAAAGNVKHDDVVEQVKKLFTKLPTDPTTASQLVAKEPAIFTGSEVRMIDDDVPLAQFAVAFSGASWTDPDSIALIVMQTLLGSWQKNSGGGKHMGSELAQRIAINEIAENMMAFNTNYKDTGLWGVYATAKPDCLDDVAYAIMYEISKLSYRVSEDDVTRARNQLKNDLLLHLDGTTPVAEDIGRQLLTYGRRMPFTELFARIDAVDASTVKRVANRFIFDRDIAITAKGPIKNLPDYNWFRRRTYWLRY